MYSKRISCFIILYFNAFYVSISCHVLDVFLPVDKNNPLLTYWNEEDEIRKRMSIYADEKFSQNYYFNNIIGSNVSKINNVRDVKRRQERDALVGSIATAVVTGMIGLITHLRKHV